MTRVSIIITCFNLGEYLEEALGSALAQTYPDFEVLLVDDGSTDAQTIALLDRLPMHPRLRVMRTANQGVARARNCGISSAGGAYILPLDADDRILPGYLARAVPILDQRPEVGFVGCHYRTFGERQDEYKASSYSLPALLVENTVPIASLFRREAWQKIGGYCPELNSIEDWDLWIGMLEAGYTGHVLPNMFFEYRIRSNSNLSHIQQPELYRQRMALLYERHGKLYDSYAPSVLIEKDVQFAKLLSYTRWLEQQCHSWEQLAQERLALIETLDRRASYRAQRQQWWRLQADRWQRIMTENRTPADRLWALTQGIQRLVVRRLSNTNERIAGVRVAKKLYSDIRQTIHHWLIGKS